ncbi:hypothetical protein O0Q50_19830 [Priestia aryabhattai]|uniref:Uncharacterized protein n=1 Tax=Priestia aryabhattai TaxID=412384 RepID=A0AAX6NCB2_PRIAR|nr:hypothetical protein [Priestia aryabhattai]MDU9693427.1 hypothetical protein [Priestia aryabhattai]
MTITKKLIQSKWETAVNKGNSKMKEELKGIIFEDTIDEGFDDNLMINIRVNGKVYHLDYDRKGKSTYSCFGFEKETGISLSDFEETTQLYSGSLREDLYEAIYTYTAEQKFKLLTDPDGLVGYRVESPKYINGNLEIVLKHPLIDREFTMCFPLASANVTKHDNHR